MDGFELEALVLLFASITSWVTLWNARTIAELNRLHYELIVLAIAWVTAAIMTGLIFK